MAQETRVTHFDKGTAAEVRKVLENLRGTGQRVRLFYGDQDTGHDWGEENDTIGTIGRSTGSKPILLLIKNARSLGGGAILTSRVLKIVDIRSRRTLYRHPKYRRYRFFYCEETDSKHPEYAAAVYRQLPDQDPIELYGRCKTVAQAARLAQFMNGERHAK